MDAALRIRTTVEPGHRIEISSPELPEGSQVEVIVFVPNQPPPPKRTIMEFLNSLPVGPRSYDSWEEMEQSFQEVRDEWDR